MSAPETRSTVEPLAKLKPRARFGGDSGEVAQLIAVVEKIGIAHVSEELATVPSLK
jgi:hypothetical protein